MRGRLDIKLSSLVRWATCVVRFDLLIFLPGGVRDPVLIAGIDAFLKSVSDYTAKMFPVLTHDPDNHKIGWHLYGKNAVMGAMEPRVSDTIHEIGVYGEVLAPTQALANAIANNARVSCLHMPYPGQVATAGNFSSPGTPVCIPHSVSHCPFTNLAIRFSWRSLRASSASLPSTT